MNMSASNRYNPFMTLTMDEIVDNYKKLLSIPVNDRSPCYTFFEDQIKNALLMKGMCQDDIDLIKSYV